MGTIRISEAELARDVHAVLAKVGQGQEFVIEQDNRPIAVRARLREILLNGGPRARFLKELLRAGRIDADCAWTRLDRIRLGGSYYADPLT